MAKTGRKPPPPLTGKRFGLLTVISDPQLRKYSSSQQWIYDVRCDCGRETYLTRHSILRGAQACKPCAMARAFARRRL